jgi:two-component system, OmpR family, sensor kinase
VNRLSVRLQITLAFTIAMAIVLAAFGAFIFIQTRDQLDEGVNDNLEVRIADLASRTQGDSGLDQQLDPEDSFAQIIGPDGEVELSTEQVAGEGATVEGPGTYDLESLDGLDGRVRVLAVELDEGRLAVAGATLEDRDESVRNLAILLLVGGPLALLLAGIGGYWVAGRALEPLERGYERERRFVDDASHELRTPLALHKAELEVALRYAEDEAALKAAIASGIEEVDRLAQLADDLLVVARSGDEGLALVSETQGAEPLLRTVSERFEERVRDAGRSIAVAADPGLTVHGDRLRIEQALTNLVENAIRHGAGRIELAARRANGNVRLSVSDEGPGFSHDFRGRAFERFSRGDAARARGGTGLGLAIVETIATAHGGRAGITAGDGAGADVWIELPGAGI